MAASKPRNAYELLLQAIQQQNQQQLNPDFGSMLSSNPESGNGSSGGLLGRLLTAPAAQNQQQPSAPNKRQILPQPRDPNFRQLARLVQPLEIASPSIVPDGAGEVGITADGPMSD